METIKPYAGTSGWSGTEASRDRALERDANGRTSATQSQVLTYVSNSGPGGATIADIRAAFPSQHHGTLSGALTALHKGGRVLRLTTRRNRCSVYIAPQFLLGRDVVPPTRIKQRDSELNDAINRVHQYLSGRSESSLRDRDVIASSWRRGSAADEFEHLRDSDLRKIMAHLR